MDNEFSGENDNDKVESEFKCGGCAAVLEFKPGTKSLTCPYCGADNEIEKSEEKIEELDLADFLNNEFAKEEKVEITSIRCTSCGASFTLKPNVTSDRCPYCATTIVVKGGTTSTLLKPKSLLPFVVDKKKAIQHFNNWIQKLWFAPSDLKKASSINEKLTGIYVPYWTYDSNTHTAYSGQRGTYYYVTETYTTTEDGESVTKTREVRKTRWHPVSGQVRVSFDDVLVIASKSLPEKYTIELEPWNLKELVPYNDKYLSGFRSESYQVDVATGFDKAKLRMDPVIRQEILRDIGGDDQRISSTNTSYHDVTFKHTLLPIWISSYRYSGKLYRFLINGQTGEVQGERPYSAIKIAMAVLAAIAVLVIAYFIFGNK
ncbi:MAG: hypothetical protein GY757_03310 [bacterium]|nr:hypothetical protein [bacterium]